MKCKASLTVALLTCLPLIQLIQGQARAESRLRKGRSIVKDEKEEKVEKQVEEAYSHKRQLSSIYSCPSASGDGIVVNPGIAEFELSGSDGLCTLVLTENNLTLFPVARSYAHHDWERYLQLGELSLEMPIVCIGGDAVVIGSTRHCVINLPNRSGLQYRLLYTQYTLPSVNDEYARFLEQTTFGPTREQINHLNIFAQSSAHINMAKWVKWQQEEVPATSHRVFYRQRVNARFESSSDIGQVTHPCQRGAFFRRFAFTVKHRYRTLTIKQIPGTTYREIALDGVVYTVVDGPLYDANNMMLNEAEKFEVCYVTGIFDNKLRLKQLGAGDYPCLDVKFNGVYGIPHVFFPTGYVHNTTKTVSFNADGHAESAEQHYFSTFTNQDMLLRITSDTFSPTFCRNVTMAGGFAPVVTIVYNGVHFISDPRFVLQVNSWESPSPDGGGSLITATNGVASHYVADCANVPRTFLNEETCKVSYSSDACWSSGLISKVVGGVVVCGSPGEVANDLALGGDVARGAFDIPQADFNDTTSYENAMDARENVWVYNALWAPDQLRQRVAWALAQILVINSSVEGNSDPEKWVNYMDIFIRHAFGNYRDILKEVHFSPMMGKMLTFTGSNSLGSEWIANLGTIKEYADENFAREIMQLFTVGLVELNIDGTHKLQNGQPIDTYSNEDIMEYAKVTTGFTRQQYRGNSAASDGNDLDPLAIDPKLRDLFPKMGLKGEYVGQGYPLCADLPDKHFLKKGAKFRIMGTSPLTELGIPVQKAWVTRSDFKVFQADPSGQLYQALCAPVGSSNNCTFPSIVKLNTSVQCMGVECSIDTLGTFLVANGIYYEYIQPPCVQQAFYKNPHKIKRKTWTSRYGSQFMCADPRTAAAGSAMCLDNGSPKQPQSASCRDLFWGERLKWSTMKQRGDTLKASDPRYDYCGSPGFLNIKWGMHQFESSNFMWMKSNETIPCHLKIKISHRGEVALFHSVPDEDMFYADRDWQQWDNNTQSFFRVHWSSTSQVKTDLIDACLPPCVPASFDGLCTCGVVVVEVEAFSDTFFVPSRDQVLALKIGSFHPDFLGLNFTTSGPYADGVKIHRITSTGERIFEAPDHFGRVLLRKNLISTVRVQGIDSLSFPNPPHFMSLSDQTVRDALYESDAMLDQVFYHDNMAPFMAIRLAQKFGISNPTPRYVEVIATAFRSGNYSDPVSGEKFGDGVYGSMAATIAATVLDREARTVLLDADPAHGSTKEPLLKLIGTMRSLEFQTIPEFPIPRFLRSSTSGWDLPKFIGQAPYRAPDVFGFFLPEYQPDGVIALAGLVAPETQIHTGDNIIGMINALSAMVKYGLDRCFGGIGPTKNWVASSSYDNCKYRRPGKFVNMSGYLGYNVSEGADVVDELATLLTAGRLSPENRATVKNAIANETDPQLAKIKAQELIVASSEFHTTGFVRKTNVNRPVPPTPVASSTPYKAVVMVILPGGYDSYNMIVPHACTGGSPITVDQQYTEVRSTVGLTQAERSLLIDVEAPEGQPCSQFAIHNQLPLVKELYDNDELSFFMNVGVLNEPVTKENYESKSVTKLFAHNHMERELQAVDPYRQIVRTGVLGRMTKYLNLNGFKAFSLAINRLQFAVFGDVTDKVNSPQPTVTDDEGPRLFNVRPATETYNPLENVRKMNGENTISSNLFAETFSDVFVRAIHQNDLLANALDNVTLPFGDCSSRSDSIRGLNMITKLMQTRDQRGSDRDLFVISLGGWDHHSALKDSLDAEFASLNDALACYTQNMKGLGLWNKTTMVVTSEFGRTLTPNSQSGSDHGWAGHYFVMGGALKKGVGRFFGEYPSDITDTSPLNTGRGRMIPTLAFESMWRPIAEWLGIPAPDIMSGVVPNAVKTETALFTKSQVFE